MGKVLIYNFSGELDEAAHLFPSERFATFAGIALDSGRETLVLDRANFRDFREFGADFMALLGGLSFRDTAPAYASAVAAEAARVLEESPSVVFLNLWHGTGFKFSVDLAAELRRRSPGLKIYGTGQKVDWFTGHILDLTGNSLDGLLTGLGYNGARSLLEGRPVESCPNMVYRSGDGVRQTKTEVLNVDDFALPVYDDGVYRRVDSKIPVRQLALSNQACPNRCAYCVRPGNYGRRLVARDIAGVAGEIARAVDQGICHFRLIDSTPPRGALTALARELLRDRMGGKIRLCGFSRVDVGDAEDFALLKEAGFIALFFGIESLDDERLKALKKGVSFGNVKKTLARAHSAGIVTVGSFIFPTPGETTQTMNNTLERMAEIRPVLDSALVLASGVYPPTEWGRSPGNFGIELGDDYVMESVIYPVKFLVPMRHWKPLPYTYGLMGKPASKVTFADIVATLEGFLSKVRGDLGYPGIPDYYYLIADLVGGDPADTTRRIVKAIMERDYESLEALFAAKDRKRGA
jgi:hypothetical protein